MLEAAGLGLVKATVQSPQGLIGDGETSGDASLRANHGELTMSQTEVTLHVADATGEHLGERSMTVEMLFSGNEGFGNQLAPPWQFEGLEGRSLRLRAILPTSVSQAVGRLERLGADGQTIGVGLDATLAILVESELVIIDTIGKAV